MENTNKSSSHIATIGVVGCGYWGPNLIRNFSSLPECRLKTVCDMDEKKLTHIKSLYPNVVTTSNFDDLINDSEINTIVIATPVSTHHPLACKALRAKKHTFIEKPLAINSVQCQEMIDLASKNSLVLMVGHTFIFTQAVRRIKEIIDSGEIGPVLYISARRLNLGLFQKDINVAWDLAPHDISIILYLLNALPVNVSCQGNSHITQGIEDITNISITFPNSIFAMIQSSWLDPKKVRELTIIGKKKMVIYDDMQPLEKIKIYDMRVQVPPHYDTFGEFQYSYHYGDMLAPYIKQVEPLKVECQHFLDCIKTGEKSETDGTMGLNVVRVLEASSQSLQNRGCCIDVKY
jgi:predicted dehydrogenase